MQYETFIMAIWMGKACVFTWIFSQGFLVHVK